MQRARVLATALVLATAASSVRADAIDDAYLEGYASALLEQRFELGGVPVRVRDGVLRLDPTLLPKAQRSAIVDALGAIEGLEIELLAPSAIVPEAGPAEAAPDPAEDTTEVAGETTGTGDEARELARRENVRLVSNALGVLPREPLFGTLIADPRWPRFSASVQFVDQDPELETVFAGNFGAMLPVYGWRALAAQWQLGLQAGVFSIFDLESESFDLVNSDFLAGLPVAARYGRLTTQLRLSHQSSHLGDEFLLRNRTERINLSFEELDLLLSFDALDWLRLYGGGGFIVRSEPHLDPWSLQAGLEMTSPKPLLGDLLFPIAALDFQTAEESGWDDDYSLRAGFELRTEFLEERRLQLLFEYFNGRSPNGQFFERDIEHFGLGLHFFF